MRSTLLALLALPLALSSPQFDKRQNATASASGSGSATSAATPSQSSSSNTTTASGPTKTIYPQTGNGQAVTITGQTYPALKQDVYLGIPFAKPPVGELRFAAPEAAVWNTTSFSATTLSPACLQAPSPVYGHFGISEDCLYLNVYTPQGIDPSKESLPVMVWIYGGSFNSGASSVYNGSAIMAQAIATGKPIIFVSINYRVGVFGFPGGEQVAQAHAANLGLRDMMLSLEWVQENIWAFGGDPGYVTVAGESAGAISISQLFLQPNISTFHGAIMESGAQSTAPIDPTAEFWQQPFDLVLNYTNCSSTVSIASNSSSTNSSSTNSSAMATTSSSSSVPAIECLRALPAEVVLNAQLMVQNITRYSGAFIWAPSVDGDLIPDSPHSLLAEGKFAHIPFISGNNLDEGTKFTPTMIDNETAAALIFASIEPVPPNATILEELFTLYPPIPSEGSPFGTGNDTFGYTPQYKQLAAILGDGAFQANRRWFLQNAVSHGLDSVWSYQFEALTPGAPPASGVYHSSELAYIFGIPQAQAAGLAEGSGEALSIYQSNFTQADVQLSETMINYWLNFVVYGDPNGNGNSNATNWPTYGTAKKLITFNTTNITIIPDTYRQTQMDFILNNPKSFNLKRHFGAL